MGQKFRFFLYAKKIIGILSKDHDPWRYLVNFLPFLPIYIYFKVDAAQSPTEMETFKGHFLNI